MRNFKPRIAAFCCNWAAYPGIEQAGMNETQYPPNLLPVTCSGIIQSAPILEAFAKSADGVFIAACPYYSKAWPHHSKNYGLSYNVARLKAILSCLGVEPERMRLEWLSVVEAPKFFQAISDFAGEMRKLGPSRLRKIRKKGGKYG